MSNPLLSLEHQLLRRTAELNPGRRWIVACSGGVDSMVLAEITRRWRPKLCDRLVIAHVHHGRGPVYRDEAQEFVRRWARSHHLAFVTNRPTPAGAADEASLRRLRFAHLERWRLKYGCDVVALAHHRDDLTETRLLRLLRGTGPAGLGAMRPRAGARVRPLLAASRAEIAAYALVRGLEWREDPANADVAHGLRAWLRHEWLPALEARRPGAGGSLARSLALLGAEAAAPVDAGLFAIHRAPFAAATRPRREGVVSDYLLRLGARDYGRNHVREVVKRLDTHRKEFSFNLLGLKFSVTPQFWWASRVCESPAPC